MKITKKNLIKLIKEQSEPNIISDEELDATYKQIRILINGLISKVENYKFSSVEIKNLNMGIYILLSNFFEKKKFDGNTLLKLTKIFSK